MVMSHLIVIIEMVNMLTNLKFYKLVYMPEKKTSKKTSKKTTKKLTKKTNKVVIVIPDEDKGILSNYGYSLKKKHEDRIKALKKAFADNPHLKILQHLNALRTLHKSNEKYYKKLDKDMKWLQKYYKINN